MPRRNALNKRTAIFAAEYVLDHNASRAARAAGYSVRTARTQGHQLLAKPDILAAIKAKQAETEKMLEMSRERLATELAKIAFADIRQVVRWGPTLSREVIVDDDGDETAIHLRNGVEVIDSDELAPETVAAIAEVSQTKAGVRVKMADKRAALMDLAKLLGYLDPEKGKGDEDAKRCGEAEVESQLSDESREEMRQRLLTVALRENLPPKKH